MAQKDRSVRRVDEKNPNLVTGGGQLIQAGSAPVATPAFPTAPPPENVIVSSGQALLRTTYTPKVLVAVKWDAPVNIVPDLYSIESAEDVNFNANLQRWSTTLTSGVIELKPSTLYWIRVQGITRGVYGEYGYPANYPVASIRTMSDTTIPSPVTGVSTNWTTADLEFAWTNPSNDNFFQTRIRIYDVFGGTLYKEVKVVGNPGSTSRWAFTAADNNQVTSNSPLTTVYYELLAYSLAGVPSATTVTGTVTKAKPTVPTGLTSTWSGDDGTYDEGVTFSWTAVTGAATYRVLIDGVVKETPRTIYTYNYTENVSDHRPTLVSGDFALSVTVQARDGLNQLSGGASGTATNLAPTSSNLTLTYAPGFSSLYAYVTPTIEIKDLYGYRWTLKSGGVNVSTVVTFTPEVTFSSLNGNYALELYAIDLFGRKSTTISGVNIILDGLTIDQLRSEATYTNSIGTSPTTLDGLKDNDLLTSVVTISSGTSWKWHKQERPLLDRYRTITLAVSGAATNWPVVYFGVSEDDTTYRWFAGPANQLGGTYGTQLIEFSSEATAQASGVLLSTNINRFDFPVVVEGRFVKLGHRGNTHNLTEYYARRLVQSDDMEAETIKAINIAAATITADKIQVFSLVASMATISGIITIGTQGGIWQGSSGSFASPGTGLKIYNQSGVGRIALYSGGITQWESDSTGRLLAGGGNVQLTASGISIFTIQTASEAITSYPQYQLRWLNKTNPSQLVASILGEIDVGSTRILRMFSYAPTSSQDSTVRIYADSTTRAGVNTPGITITNQADLTLRTVDITAGDQVNLNSTLTTVSDGLNVGTPATDATTGRIRTEDSITSESNSIASLGSQAGLVFEDRATSDLWQWYGNTTARLWNGSADTISISSAGLLTVMETDSGTTNVVDVIDLRRDSSGTPGVGFGSNLRINLETSTTPDQPAAVFQTTWQTATHASRKARITMHAYDTVAREFIRGEASGSAAMLGFYGTAATAKLTVTGAKGGNAALTSLLTQLATLGLITDSST